MIIWRFRMFPFEFNDPRGRKMEKTSEAYLENMTHKMGSILLLKFLVCRNLISLKPEAISPSKIPVSTLKDSRTMYIDTRPDSNNILTFWVIRTTELVS